MAFTNDNAFQSKIRPFSEEFNQKMQGLAADVSALNAMLPTINYAIQLFDPGGAGGGGGGVSVFPAYVYEGSHPNYQWYETDNVLSLTPRAEGKNSFEQGGAANTLEISIGAGETIPPGLDCLDVIGNVDVRPIRGVVMMSFRSSDVESDDDDDDSTNGKYWFACPPSVCPNCTAGYGLQEEVTGIEKFYGKDPQFEDLTGKFMDTESPVDHAPPQSPSNYTGDFMETEFPTDPAPPQDPSNY
jgi:hypothetical protein